jgi:hypothetical protein
VIENDLAMRCRAAILLGGVSAALVLATACSEIDAIDKGPGYYNGYESVTVDGTDDNGHVLPPVGYQCYPHYSTGNGYVYDVYGHYYKEHDGEWSLLRSAPSLVRYQTPQVGHDPRCLEYPP